jgi:hypothetical protein
VPLIGANLAAAAAGATRARTAAAQHHRNVLERIPSILRTTGPLPTVIVPARHRRNTD